MRRFLVFFSACVLSTAAQAQLDLPGATAPAPVGTVSKPQATSVKPRLHLPRIAAPATPADSALAGKTLMLNGGKSQIAFTPRDKTVDVSRLLFSGRKISNSHDECQVDVSGMPLALTSLGKTNGVARFSIPLPACPLSFDVLDGAVLTAGESGTCSFKDADCEVGVAGLWGPAAGEIGPDQVKTIERERMRAERTVREAYKGLVSSTKDRAVIRGYASDQAGFSSHREETCRDYIGESRHGFCASRLTEARAMTLDAELVVAAAAKEARKKKRAGRSAKE
ncbi:hypothetical protein [Lichenifustis flavocetrariae]|uniref:Uncharacterized protein n=1 Tax=Lichenifustis flavocetrariae TaxID=2949735 RepID=A0AA42CHI3_9HYPH|nr:hypothetical protein [Lichenifustis flavocetrariae]MCW6507578.1 hypothetical protein [Lichenifustis flavocetrariae]